MRSKDHSVQIPEQFKLASFANSADGDIETLEEAGPDEARNNIVFVSDIFIEDSLEFGEDPLWHDDIANDYALNEVIGE